MKTVMIVHPVGNYLLAHLLRGISDYANEHKTWIVQINPDRQVLGLRSLETWPGHGVIASLTTKAEVAVARALPQPVVNLSGAVCSGGVPRVMTDQIATGRLAAEHLLACGLPHFAYYGESDRRYSDLRKQGFLERLTKEGRPCEVLDVPTLFKRQNPWYKWMEPLERWLQGLQLPVGVLAVHDFAGTLLIEACIRLGLRVPQEVAVIGVGNDVVTCEFSAVPLSSIARKNREVGYQAAKLLDQLMHGQPPPAEDVLLPPEGVVHRQSTDMIIIDDFRIAAAVKYLREHLGEIVTVDALCRKMDISHRALELHFQKNFGRTPSDYITHLRVERVKKLLASQEKPKSHWIAKRCGFSSLRHLRDVFKRQTGMTPTEYHLHNKTLPQSSPYE